MAHAVHPERGDAGCGRPHRVGRRASHVEEFLRPHPKDVERLPIDQRMRLELAALCGDDAVKWHREDDQQGVELRWRARRG